MRFLPWRVPRGLTRGESANALRRLSSRSAWTEGSGSGSVGVARVCTTSEPPKQVGNIMRKKTRVESIRISKDWNMLRSQKLEIKSVEIRGGCRNSPGWTRSKRISAPNSRRRRQSFGRWRSSG